MKTKKKYQHPILCDFLFETRVWVAGLRFASNNNSTISAAVSVLHNLQQCLSDTL